MRLTIVPADRTVIVDGVRRTVDCSDLASCVGVHAVQWDGSSGEIEYEHKMRGNEPLQSIAQFQDVIDAWNATPPPGPRR